MIRIGGSIVLLSLLLLVLPFADLMAAVRRVDPATWVIAVAVYLCLHLIGIVKWRMLVNVAGAGLSPGDASRAYYWGLFGNTFLPSVVGGDVVRIGAALGTTKSRSGLVLGSVIDRMFDVTGLLVLAGIGAVLSPNALDPHSRRVFIAAVLVAALASLAGAAAIIMLPMRRLPFKARRKVISLRNAFRATSARPAVPATAFVLGLILQSSLIVLNYRLGLIMGIGIPLYVWFFAWPMAKIAALLPVTQGGIGVREAAIAALLAPFGISAALAVATGLVFQAVVIAGGLLAGGVVVLLRPGTAQLTHST